MTKAASKSARFTRALVALTVGGATFLGLSGWAAAAPAPPGMSASTMAVVFEWAIDVERARYGLDPLAVDPAVSGQAQTWSGGMALYNTLVEDRSYGAELTAAIPSWHVAAENVGVGSTASIVESAFMASAPHRANVLGNFTHMGVGVVIDGSGQIWVTERFYS